MTLVHTTHGWNEIGALMTEESGVTYGGTIKWEKTRSTLAGSAPAKSMAADVRFPAGTSLING